MTPPEAAATDGSVARADAALTRVGLTTPLRRDGALALVIALASVGVIVLGLADPVQRAALGDDPVTVPAVLVLLAAQGGVLTVRRTNPALCLGIVVALQIVLVAVLPPTGGVRGPACVVAAYTCGARLPARRALAVSVLAALVDSAGFVGFASGSWPREGAAAAAVVVGQVVSTALTYVAAAVLGGYVATRRRYGEMARLRAAEAVEAQRARTDAAVGAERTRMARELHDIAAHHLAAMVVQASMVERLIDRDPEAARRTAAEVRAQGRATLHDLRLAVDALRERGDGGTGDGAPEEGAPVPGLAVLAPLVAGAGAELDVVGPPRELSPVADVSAYRVAQEALSNARDHAPGAPVAVRVEHADTATVLEVRNGPPPRDDAAAPPAERGPRRGLGLVGMRERAELIGADLEAGPLEGGGWRVRLAIPWAAGSAP